MWTANPEISKAEPQVIKKLIINQLHSGPQQPSVKSELLIHHSQHLKGSEMGFPFRSLSLFWSLGREYPAFQDAAHLSVWAVNTDLWSQEHPSWNSPPSCIREREQLLQLLIDMRKKTGLWMKWGEKPQKVPDSKIWWVLLLTWMVRSLLGWSVVLRAALKDSENHFHSDGALEHTEFGPGKESFKHLSNNSS